MTRLKTLQVQLQGCHNLKELLDLRTKITDYLKTATSEDAEALKASYREMQDILKTSRTQEDPDERVYSYEGLPWDDETTLVVPMVAQTDRDLPAAMLMSISEPMPSLSRREIFDDLFIDRNDLATSLHNKAIVGGLATCPFRSVAWRLFLGALSYDPSAWAEELATSRLAYEELKKEMNVDPRDDVNADSSINHPLSQDPNSPWQKHFEDEELRDTIIRDVHRTFPDVEYFNSQRVYTTMTEILFCYCKKNSHLGYRQGMHELLAPILMLIEQEAVSPLDEDDSDKSDSTQDDAPSPEMKLVLDSKHTEADAYTTFSCLMDVMSQFYAVEDVGDKRKRLLERQRKQRLKEKLESIPEAFAPEAPTDGKLADDPADANAKAKASSEGTASLHASAHTPANLQFASSDVHGIDDEDPAKTPLQRKLISIQQQMLRDHDPELYQHLEKLGIPAQVYGVRWIRLLFSREVPFHDTLTLWDAIFAEEFMLIDYLCLAMLEYIKDHVIKSGYVGTLSTIMRFPAIDNISDLIQKALHIYQPQRYPNLEWFYRAEGDADSMNASRMSAADDEDDQNLLSYAVERTMEMTGDIVTKYLFSSGVHKETVENLYARMMVLGETMDHTLTELRFNIRNDGRVVDLDKMILIQAQLNSVCESLLGRRPLPDTEERKQQLHNLHTSIHQSSPEEGPTAQPSSSLQDQKLNSIKESTASSKNASQQRQQKTAQRVSHESTPAQGNRGVPRTPATPRSTTGRGGGLFGSRRRGPPPEELLDTLKRFPDCPGCHFEGEKYITKHRIAFNSCPKNKRGLMYTSDEATRPFHIASAKLYLNSKIYSPEDGGVGILSIPHTALTTTFPAAKVATSTATTIASVASASSHHDTSSESDSIKVDAEAERTEGVQDDAVHNDDDDDDDNNNDDNDNDKGNNGEHEVVLTVVSEDAPSSRTEAQKRTESSPDHTEGHALDDTRADEPLLQVEEVSSEGDHAATTQHAPDVGSSLALQEQPGLSTGAPPTTDSPQSDDVQDDQ